MSENARNKLVQIMSPVYYIHKYVNGLLYEMAAKRKGFLLIAFEDVQQLNQASDTLLQRIKFLPNELADCEFQEFVSINSQLKKSFTFQNNFLRGPHYKISKTSLDFVSDEYEAIINKLQKSVPEEYWG